jgi:porin
MEICEGTVPIQQWETHENTLEKRLRFEEMLSDLSARFMAVRQDQIDSEIDSSLRQIMDFFQVDLCALLEVQADNAFVRVSHGMAAVASIRTEPVPWTVMVFDPKDRTNDYFPGDLFKEGVNVSVSGAHTTMLSGRKTTYAVAGIYSTAEGADYSSLPPGMGVTTKRGSYNVSFEFKHNLQESATQPNASWGFYFKAAIADGNPNYVQSSVIAGIGGKALFFDRPQDSFGLGLYRYNLSDELQNSLSPSTKFRDESAVEAFYSYAVTPWLYVGEDIQYIKPASGSFENALVCALRTQIRF